MAFEMAKGGERICKLVSGTSGSKRDFVRNMTNEISNAPHWRDESLAKMNH